jgi:hypothetical protein
VNEVFVLLTLVGCAVQSWLSNCCLHGDN